MQVWEGEASLVASAPSNLGGRCGAGRLPLWFQGADRQSWLRSVGAGSRASLGPGACSDAEQADWRSGGSGPPYAQVSIGQW